MKSRSSAPGKVILFGEHFVVYGSKAILCAINRRTVVSAQTTQDRIISIKSDVGSLSSDIETELVEIPTELRPLFYLAKKITQTHSHEGVTINVESEIPPGIGLGSSSACCVAGASAISALFEKPDRDKILKLAIEAEKTIHQNSSGADCTVCLHGGMMTYSKREGFERLGSVPGFKLVVANSNLEHSTGKMVSGVKMFQEENKAEFLEMCNMQDGLTERALDMIEKNDLVGLGACIEKNQKILEAIGVSNEKLRIMINMVNKTSFGSKITGAGGGGCTFALCDDTNVQATKHRLNQENIECFSAEIDLKGLDTF